jgi:hypothetical protein
MLKVQSSQELPERLQYLAHVMSQHRQRADLLCLIQQRARLGLQLLAAQLAEP